MATMRVAPWKQANLPRCGYCQPGPIIQAAALRASAKRVAALPVPRCTQTHLQVSCRSRRRHGAQRTRVDIIACNEGDS
jgi:hypothetical protein